MHSYTTARTIYSILEFIAWVIVIGGIIFAITGAGTVVRYTDSPAGLTGAIPGLFASLIGIYIVAKIQYYRAGVDTAEMTGQLLSLSREQLQLTKDAQKARLQAPPTTAPKPAATPEKPAPDLAGFDPVTLARSAKPASSEPASIPSTKPTYQYKVEHQGETIELIRGKAIWQGKEFNSVDDARSYIDCKHNTTSSMEQSAQSTPQLIADRTQ